MTQIKMSALHALIKMMPLRKAEDNFMKKEFTTSLLKKKMNSLLAYLGLNGPKQFQRHNSGCTK